MQITRDDIRQTLKRRPCVTVQTVYCILYTALQSPEVVACFAVGLRARVAVICSVMDSYLVMVLPKSCCTE
jgi:hypothetical protein